jgi:hypothetical protein
MYPLHIRVDYYQAGGVAQLIEHLPSKHKALAQTPTKNKTEQNTAKKQNRNKKTQKVE